MRGIGHVRTPTLVDAIRVPSIRFRPGIGQASNEQNQIFCELILIQHCLGNE